ncbi:carboxylesterase family protein (lipO) [Minicystis rosea]|nr:carboxylesterase family protein (lipO) [Minicystis rosea]
MQSGLSHHPLAIPYAFLLVASVGALFSANAARPFVRDGRLSIGVFFAGWLTSELAIHHLVWQVIATAAFVWAGALAAWPGFVALALVLISWVGLVRMTRVADSAGDVVEHALVEALGRDYADRIDAAERARLDTPLGIGQLIQPFLPHHPEVERIRGLAYGSAGHRNELDIYRPRDAGAKRPVLVQVHGGAWVLGDKSQQGLPLMTHMASLGWVCVAINYRLSPRATFPDHIIDVKRALAWVKAHIAEHGGDPDFVVITGGSAGGHLCSLAALTPNDPEYQPGFEAADTSVRACVPFYGVYDFTNRKGIGREDMRGLLSRVVMKRRFAEAVELFDRASPMSRVNEHAPPFFVIHGTNDTLVPVEEARLFVELLRAASHEPVAYAELPGAQHAFEVFSSPRTVHVVRGVARFLAHTHAMYRATQAAPARPSDATERTAVMA